MTNIAAPLYFLTSLSPSLVDMGALRIVVFALLLVPSWQNHSLSKRHLLFPRYTVLQFTCGLSVPLILPSRSINISWCVQQNYDLPWNLTNFRIMDLRSMEDNDFDMDRITFYQYIVDVLESFDLNGEDCLLKSVCEISEIPLHVHEEGLLEKILHFLLTPSVDFSNYENNTLQHRMLVAEHLGRVQGNCDQLFSECDVSLVDIFTGKFSF